MAVGKQLLGALLSPPGLGCEFVYSHRGFHENLVHTVEVTNHVVCEPSSGTVVKRVIPSIALMKTPSLFISC